ncbi:MAG TPA: bifunctional 3,4-dihydroxy-2-butanone-4-phosphate synthase/GTP cyclohydrolase II, partial [Myxococcales bacterium]|nr:bifunctional 3,4-dihydroxy-2-butanone-4-phosphate synthase/GTP cyclohydrolase II [Myxococcales bacterium]
MSSAAGEPLAPPARRSYVGRVATRDTRLDAIERVHRALEDIRAGRMVILVDDEDRENEGDLV